MEAHRVPNPHRRGHGGRWSDPGWLREHNSGRLGRARYSDSNVDAERDDRAHQHRGPDPEPDPNAEPDPNHRLRGGQG